MESAFGVEHPGVVFKAAGSRRDDERKHYGRMAGTTGAMGALSAGTGAGALAVGVAEKKGKDPMGATQRTASHLKPISPEAKLRVLKPIAQGHFKQAAAMGGVGAAGLGLAGAYRHKQKMSKADRRRGTDAALGAGAVGAGAGTGYVGVKHAKHMGNDAREARSNMKIATTNMATEPQHKEFWRGLRGVNRTVRNVKGLGAAAAVGAGAAGGAGALELGRYHTTKKLRKRPS